MSVLMGKKFKHEGKPKSSKMTTLFSCKSGYIQWNSVVSVALAKRIHELRAEDKLDQVYSSCGRKMKTLSQLYSFVSSALLSSENKKSESEERFKHPVQALPSNVGFFHRVEKIRNMYLTM